MEKIALLADSFLSPLLLETLADLGVSAFAQMPLPPGISRIDEGELRRRLAGADRPLLYCNAEDVLPLVTEGAGDRVLTEAIAHLKDKVLLRELLRGITPELYFAEVAAEDLPSFRVPENRRLILKPAVGFLSLGVARVKGRGEWLDAVRRIDSELAAARGIFAPSVLRADRFIVEEFVEGDEYACDGYFDGRGEPVVLQVARHHFRDEDDTRDLLYTTGSAMMAELLPGTLELLGRIGERAGLRRFPFHMEFRLKGEDLQVIEINPLRFGGFGLADLARAAFGVNPYACYLEQKRPDWEAILSAGSSKTYAFVLGRVPPGAVGKDPDHRAFRATFHGLLDYAPIDHRRFPCFCRVLAKADGLEDFAGYLRIDFGRYFS